MVSKWHRLPNGVTHARRRGKSDEKSHLVVCGLIVSEKEVRREARVEWLSMKRHLPIAADPRVTRFACAENAGILGAMRRCLARAARGFVVPLDADDVLEPDALEVLAAAIDREQADFVFSDEDHLTGERMHTPYARPGFDPVLNLESSYIWHLCAFSRDRALELGVYADERAEYCHDWDTVVRFSEAGLRLLAHELAHVMQNDRGGETARIVHRQQLDVTAAGVASFTTPQGSFYRFPLPAARSNRTARPQFQHPQSALQAYAGAGASGTQLVHPAVSAPLNTLMTALIAEGTRFNDESLKQAVVASAVTSTIAANIGILRIISFLLGLE